jgi:hypothetical protein
MMIWGYFTISAIVLRLGIGYFVNKYLIYERRMETDGESA